MSSLIRLQVPMSQELRLKSLKKAHEYGYSSIQEVIRTFLVKFTKNKIVPTFHEEEEISPKTLARLERIVKKHENDIKAGKAKLFSTPEEALRYLNKNE